MGFYSTSNTGYSIYQEKVSEFRTQLAKVLQGVDSYGNTITSSKNFLKTGNIKVYLKGMNPLSNSFRISDSFRDLFGSGRDMIRQGNTCYRLGSFDRNTLRVEMHIENKGMRELVYEEVYVHLNLI